MVGTRTITRSGLSEGPRPAQAPSLFLVLRCDEPLQAGARYRLGGVDTVLIGRAPAASLERNGASLRIGVRDARVSGDHARLQRVLGEWMVEDLGSKNHTFLDGRPVGRSPIGDGAVLEIGHTFFLFRTGSQGGASGGLPDGEAPREAESGLATLHPALEEEFGRLELVARSPLPVLLRGEIGTGKATVAAALHRLSGRSGPLRAVHCAGIAPALAERDLFGSAAGAGAGEGSAGLLRGADGGTLLLDEVGELPLSAQAALLHALELGEVQPVGAAGPLKVDLRVVAASCGDLQALAAQERFRPDLLARLSGYLLTLPPLRERREDFSLLIAALLAKIGAPRPSFSGEAARALLRHRWPLNLRELEKCLSAAVVLSRGGRIGLEHLPEALRVAPPAPRPASVAGGPAAAVAPPARAPDAGALPEAPLPSRLQSLIAELQRRRVFRSLVAYGVFAFAVLQVIEPIAHGLHWPDEVISYTVVGLGIGFLAVVALAWVFDINAGRIERTVPSPVASPRPRGAWLVLALVGLAALAALPAIAWYVLHARAAQPPASQPAPGRPAPPGK